MKTFNIITILFYWIAMQIEMALSFVVTVLTDAVELIDRYVLPIYSNPFIEGAIKPPTAC